MCTKGSCIGLTSSLDPQRSSAASAPSLGRTLTPYFAKVRFVDHQEIRISRAERLKKHVPLRRKIYSRLLSVLNTAQQKGQALQQVIDDLTARAPTEPEAALLLRDLWEVCAITESAIQQYDKPDADTTGMIKAGERLVKRPFGGEEVLF